MTMRPVLTLFFLLTTLAGAADPSPEVARLAYAFSVAAGILPAVEPGILPGGMGVWFAKPLSLRTSGPGGKMPPSTAARMAAATDVNATLSTYRLAAEVRGKGWIVFPARSEQGDWDLFLTRPDGSQRRPLTRTPEWNEAAPQFSRDGTRLLYRRLKRAEAISGNRYGEQGALIAANGDGTDARVLGAEGELPWASYVFSVVGTSRCDVRAACSGATPSNASAARSFVPPATTRAGTAQRGVPTITLNSYPLRVGREGRTCLGSLFGDPDTVPSKVPLSVRKYLFSRSAAVFGSSDVSAPKTQERYQVSPARKLAAPEDGRTPLNRYVRARERGRVRLDCMDTAKR